MVKKIQNFQFDEGEKNLSEGKFHQAIKIFLKIIEEGNGNFLVYWYLGHAYFKLHHYTEAIQNIKKSIELKTEDQINLNFLGQIYLQKNDYNNALNYFQKALKLNENNEATLKNLASIFLQLGNIEESKKFYKLLIEKNPKELSYHFVLNKIDKNYFIKEELLKNIDTSPNSNIYLNLIYAKKFELKKNFKYELDHLLKAHLYYSETKTKTANQQINYYSNLLPKFLAKIEKINYLPKNNLKPIFILGLPRSGTTLMEKVINSGNNSLTSLGESDCFDKVIFSNKLLINEKSINLIEEKIINQYYDQGLNKETLRFTDKSIANILNLKLIYKIFPKAKFIYCKKNLIANIVGILRAFLPDIYWAHSLETINLIIEYYLKNINWMKKNQNLDYMEINFEEFTEDPLDYSKKIFKFLGLNWSKKVINNEKNFIIKTASNIQARKKIYKQDLSHIHHFDKLFKQQGFDFSKFD